jgi:hypothetical protein
MEATLFGFVSYALEEAEGVSIFSGFVGFTANWRESHQRAARGYWRRAVDRIAFGRRAHQKK